jgi:predicted nucleic acid-binding protein
MGLILDSSVIIAAERGGEPVAQLIERIVRATGDQDAALSSVGLTELVHGIYRAPATERRLRRETFMNDLLASLTVLHLPKKRLSWQARSMENSKAAA